MPHSRRTPRVAVAVLTAVLLPALGGCSGPRRHITGVQVENGEPVVLLRACHRADYDLIEIYEAVGRTWVALRPPPGTGGPRSFPLHHPPAGWTSDGGPLPPAGDGPRSYGVDVRTTEPAASRVSFGTDDLARLSPGQVWAHARVWTLEEFDSYARTAC
ncbi:hypothetical protein ACFVVU_14315 [Kitasatospora sp. NPDC057965]|uniref:hypothetical protein n=1 Tax=Kitasatospora sp. NPDC057965 TaxID=3346291 RepID=UPI0036DD5D4F